MNKACKSLELSEGVKLKPNEWKMYYRLDNALRYLPDPHRFISRTKKPKRLLELGRDMAIQFQI